MSNCFWDCDREKCRCCDEKCRCSNCRCCCLYCLKGAAGPKGETGARGARGEKGEQGERGAEGLAAIIEVKDPAERVPYSGQPYVRDTGSPSHAILEFGIPEGQPGEKGQQGEPGEKGEKGEQGEKGEDGAKGATGEKGEQGERGEKGAQGERGTTGPAGASFVSDYGSYMGWQSQTLLPGDSVSFPGPKSQRGMTLDSTNTKVTLGPVRKIIRFAYGIDVQSINSGSPTMEFFVNGVSTSIKTNILIPGHYSMEFFNSYLPNSVVEIKIVRGGVTLNSNCEHSYFTCLAIE